eukprot:CAMPEP_0202729044 /NCGR_PEP_ID=MMETSP1385-20130828/185934_1 /ASSEMBLY_ACC=CAM_ASM_000861 /TAXON_ID=933848 /ORGANISM="Elphidium margaritaceum" /LENGTH=72 /DNA_ID=CAMNT_0049395299 /DNA_START=1062 /DNA_END=1280 /DNA_ORIENTATION=-
MQPIPMPIEVSPAHKMDSTETDDAAAQRNMGDPEGVADKNEQTETTVVTTAGTTTGVDPDLGLHELKMMVDQ